MSGKEIAQPWVMTMGTFFSASAVFNSNMMFYQEQMRSFYRLWVFLYGSIMKWWSMHLHALKAVKSIHDLFFLTVSHRLNK